MGACSRAQEPWSTGGIGGGSGEGAATPGAVEKLWWEQTDSKQEMEGEAEHVSMEDDSCFNR